MGEGPGVPYAVTGIGAMASRKVHASAVRSLGRSQRPRIIQSWSRVPAPIARHYSREAQSAHQAWKRPSTAILAAAATLAVVYSASQLHEAQAEVPTSDSPELLIEKSKKKKGASKEEIRDLISSQHLQVKKSWENPGVYAWDQTLARLSHQTRMKHTLRLRGEYHILMMFYCGISSSTGTSVQLSWRMEI